MKIKTGKKSGNNNKSEQDKFLNQRILRKDPKTGKMVKVTLREAADEIRRKGNKLNSSNAERIVLFIKAYQEEVENFRRLLSVYNRRN